MLIQVSPSSKIHESIVSSQLLATLAETIATRSGKRIMSNTTISYQRPIHSQDSGQQKGHLPERKAKKTYNTRDSLVVTDPTTSLALLSLCYRVVVREIGGLRTAKKNRLRIAWPSALQLLAASDGGDAAAVLHRAGLKIRSNNAENPPPEVLEIRRASRLSQYL